MLAKSIRIVVQIEKVVQRLLVSRTEEKEEMSDCCLERTTEGDSLCLVAVVAVSEEWDSTRSDYWTFIEEIEIDES